MITRDIENLKEALIGNQDKMIMEKTKFMSMIWGQKENDKKDEN